MAVKHNATHTADNQLTAAEYDEAHTVEAGTIVDDDIGAHTTTKITSPEAKVVFGDTGHAHGGGTGGKQVDHGALGGLTDDDHTQYQKESEKSAANGYASLGADSKVPDGESQVPSTHPSATTAIHGVGASTVESASGSQAKVDTHDGLTGPHSAATSVGGKALPAGVIVGTSDTQTLTNKTWVHRTTHVSGGGDALYIYKAYAFAVTGTLTIGADKAPTLEAIDTETITEVRLVVKTAPTGAAIIVDVNKNGTTIFTTQTNRPQIAISATEGQSTTIEVSGLVKGDNLTIDIDQIGSTVAGADLTVEVICKQYLKADA